MPIKVHGDPQSVDHQGSEFRTYVDPDLYLDYAPKIPVLAMLFGLGSREHRDWMFDSKKKSPIPRITKIDYGAGYGTGDTVFTVVNGQVFRINDQILNLRTKELYRCVGAGPTSVTVGRDLNGAGPVALLDGDVLKRVSPATRHGEAPTQFATMAEESVTHYIQQFSKTIQTNHEMDGVQLLGGDRRDLEQGEKYLELLDDVEHQFLFGTGRRLISGGGGGTSTSEVGTQASSTHPLYMSHGLRSLCSTHFFDNHNAGARQTITENAMNAALQDGIFSENPGSLVTLFVSTNVSNAFNQWGRDKLVTKPSDIIHGVHCQLYKADGGWVELIDHPSLTDYDTNVGWNGSFFAINPNKVHVGSIPGQATEPILREDIVKTGVRQWVDEWLWALGLICHDEKWIFWGEGVSGGA